MNQESKSTAKLILIFLLGIVFVVLFVGAMTFRNRSKIILTPDVYQVDLKK